MGYRATAYLVGTPIMSAPVSERSVATAILDRMLAMPGVSGGYVSEHVPGIGWCLATDDDDSETVGERGVW